jgi:hypothetical protein
LGSLPTNRQTAAVPDASIGAEIHQSLDIHSDLTTQITFDREPRDGIAKASNFRLT